MVQEHGAGRRLVGRGIAVRFGGIRALEDVDVDVEIGRVLGIIGPNGAGKTTLLNVLSGFQRPTSGSVELDGLDITGVKPSRMAHLGVARTFQGLRLFGGLTAFENVEVASLAIDRSRRRAHESAAQLLSSLGLESVAHVKASALPHGDERRLALARALAGRPRFLLLDEPIAGLDEHESDQLLESLLWVKEALSCGVVVVEHDMRFVMQFCEVVQVLDEGRTIGIGSPEAIRRDENVLHAYLGAKGR